MAPGGRDGGVVGGGRGKLDGEQEGVGREGDVGDDSAGGEEVFIESSAGVSFATLVEDGDSECEEGEEVDAAPARGAGWAGPGGLRGTRLCGYCTRSEVF